MTTRLPYLAAAWSLGYGLLGLAWTAGTPGFPFGPDGDPDGAKVSLLDSVTAGRGAPVIAAVGLAGALLALVLARWHVPRRLRLVATAPAWLLAVLLALVVTDYRPLLAVVRLPMLLIGAPFGWPEKVGPGDWATLFMTWPVLNQIVLMAGGVLWAAVAVAVDRRCRDACARCGRTGTPARWTTPASAARWGRWAVAVAVAVPVFYAVTRWAWALGIPLGLPRDDLRSMAAELPGVWWAGAVIATLALGGAVLTVGLVRPWGEVYPRWIPRLAGRRVRPRTAIVPASLVALLVTSTGLMDHRAWLNGDLPADVFGPQWGTVLPGQFWTAWGLALAAATFAYHLRRRERCPVCGLGDAPLTHTPGHGRAADRAPARCP